MLVHDVRFTPARGAYYHRKHFKLDEDDGRQVLAVSIAYVGCCRFEKQYDAVKTMLLTNLRDKMNYQEVLAKTAAAVPSAIATEDMIKPRKAIARRRDSVRRMHNTARLRCNLDATTPCSAVALDPGNMKDMTKFLLHLSHVLRVVGPEARSKMWMITFDDATYKTSHKIIPYLSETVSAAGKHDTM